MRSTMEPAARSFILAPCTAAKPARCAPLRSVSPMAPPMSSSPLALMHALAPSSVGQTRCVSAKELIFSKGDVATQLFFILDGRVKVSALSQDGKEIIFAILGPGELLGELAVIEGTEHSSSVWTLEPTELLSFGRRDFLALLHNQPSFALSLLMTVCSQLRKTSELVEDISFLPLPVRLAKRLLALARSYGIPSSQGIRIELHLCQQELANMVNTTRESVNKQLAVWHKEGLISTRKGYVAITHLQTFAARHHL